MFFQCKFTYLSSKFFLTWNMTIPKLFWEIKNVKEQLSSQTQVLTSFSEPIANFLLLMIFMATFLHVFLSKASFTSPQAPLQGNTQKVIVRLWF